MADRKPILCLDFDGVLHSYTSGWKGATVISDAPVPGAIEFMARAKDSFELHIFGSRSSAAGGIDAMRRWLRDAIEYHFDCMFVPGHPDDFDAAQALINALKFPTEKPAAMISIDDRALTFTGIWPSIDELRRFQPWNKQPAILRPNSSVMAGSLNARRIRLIQMVSKLMPRWVRLDVRLP